MTVPSTRSPWLELIVALLALGSGTVAADTVFVDSVADGDDGECSVDCTLREALTTVSPGESVALPAGTYRLTLGTLVVSRDVSLVGAGARSTIIEATTTDRAVRVAPGVTVSLSDLTIRRDTPGLFGGGVRNEGVVSLTRCALVDNRPSSARGGGLNNLGTAFVRDCLVRNNMAEFGAGIASSDDAFTVIENTTISGNRSVLDGAGVFNELGRVVIRNSTVANNDATVDGASGLGSFVLERITVHNTIVAGVAPGEDCAPLVVDPDSSHNLDTDGSCFSGAGTGNFTADPLLGPLGDHGGPADTHLPEEGSPAIDAGSPATPDGQDGACLAVDSRGVPRPQGPRCDLGAVELETCGSDADGDGVCDGVDNCPQGFNPDQGPAPFGRTIVATSRERLVWFDSVDVLLVVGNLAAVESLEVLDVEALDDATGLGISFATLPPDRFFLVRLAGTCANASWQTVIDNEPERDLRLP